MKYEKGEEDLKQAELEIEALLKDFQGEEIKVPEERLEEALREHLDKLHQPKKHQLAKVAASISVLLLAGSLMIPQVQVFAKEVIESIFKDKGIENAAQAGYPSIQDVEGAIGDYKMRLFNIYIDEMRLSFEVEVTGLPEKENLWYSIEIDDDWQVNGKAVDEVGISSSSFTNEAANIEVNGQGVKYLLAQDEITIPFRLFSSKYDPNGVNGQTVLGETALTLTIPEELKKPALQYEINQDILLEKGNMHLETLEVSPTMMGLSYTSEIEDGYITGLKGLCLIGEDKTYGDHLPMGGPFDEKGGVTEYMIPSIYFEKRKQFILQAEGYEYKKKTLEELTISQEDVLPRQIIYDGIPLTLTSLHYQEGLLEVGIKDSNLDGHRLNHIIINGIPNQSMNVHMLNAESDDLAKVKENEYIVRIKVPEAKSYKLALDFTLEKEEPISMEISLLEDN